MNKSKLMMAAVMALGVLGWAGAGQAASRMSRAKYLRWLKKNNPRKYAQLMRKYGGSRGGTRRGVQLKLPKIKWKSLNGALGSNKPVVVIFTIKGLKSAATFNRAGTPEQVKALRRELSKSGAVPVKLLPPEVPNVRGMGDESRRLALKRHAAAMKKYRDAARKYGATAYPTMVFLAPGGDLMARLYSPSASAVHQTLQALPAAVVAHRKKKAAQAAAKAKKAAQAAAKAKRAAQAAAKAKKADTKRSVKSSSS